MLTPRPGTPLAQVRTVVPTTVTPVVLAPTAIPGPAAGHVRVLRTLAVPSSGTGAGLVESDATIPTSGNPAELTGVLGHWQRDTTPTGRPKAVTVRQGAATPPRLVSTPATPAVPASARNTSPVAFQQRRFVSGGYSLTLPVASPTLSPRPVVLTQSLVAAPPKLSPRAAPTVVKPPAATAPAARSAGCSTPVVIHTPRGGSLQVPPGPMQGKELDAPVVLPASSGCMTPPVIIHAPRSSSFQVPVGGAISLELEPVALVPTPVATPQMVTRPVQIFAPASPTPPPSPPTVFRGPSPPRLVAAPAPLWTKTAQPVAEVRLATPPVPLCTVVMPLSMQDPPTTTCTPQTAIGSGTRLISETSTPITTYRLLSPSRIYMPEDRGPSSTDPRLSERDLLSLAAPIAPPIPALAWLRQTRPNGGSAGGSWAAVRADGYSSVYVEEQLPHHERVMPPLPAPKSPPPRPRRALAEDGSDDTASPAPSSGFNRNAYVSDIPSESAAKGAGARDSLTNGTPPGDSSPQAASPRGSGSKAIAELQARCQQLEMVMSNRDAEVRALHEQKARTAALLQDREREVDALSSKNRELEDLLQQKEVVDAGITQAAEEPASLAASLKEAGLPALDSASTPSATPSSVAQERSRPNRLPGSKVAERSRRRSPPAQPKSPSQPRSNGYSPGSEDCRGGRRTVDSAKDSTSGAAVRRSAARPTAQTGRPLFI
eukprot:TRINITY_DN30304_c0_g1_i1.p1 TRINITY_DN30304_c0_g1~~TRINITY_DN30304_c0_g1_i1.p1  ORF type:complete len:715 (+),score=101.93 TRINITY_DN30304_c0_g1_i1:67-2211(+)